MGAAWLISWQRPPWSYTINWCHVSRCCRPKQLMSMLSTCHSACIQQQAYALSWLQWAATVWMHVMLSLKDSRHGLSSIYSFFLHFEKSATFGTVGCSKVFYGNTQWNFSLRWFCLNLILFVLIPACGDVALCFDVCSVLLRWRGSLLRRSQRRGEWHLQAMRLWRIQQVQTNSAFFKFTALFAWLRMSLSDCDWVLKSQKVYKLVPVASQIFLLTVAQLFCLSLTSRSQVTLSRVTLLLISQWLRHLFRWANASATDYCIISSPLLQLYIQRVWGKRSIVLVLRLKVISDYTDRGLHTLVRIYAKVQLADLVASVPLEHYYFSLVWNRSLTCRRSWTTCLFSRVCSNTG